MGLISSFKEQLKKNKKKKYKEKKASFTERLGKGAANTLSNAPGKIGSAVGSAAKTVGSSVSRSIKKSIEEKKKENKIIRAAQLRGRSRGHEKRAYEEVRYSGDSSVGPSLFGTDNYNRRKRKKNKLRQDTGINWL